MIKFQRQPNINTSSDVKYYKGNLEETINDRYQKCLRITNEITCFTKNPTLKEHKVEVGRKIINMILLLYGCETWTGMSKEQLSKLEKVQKDVFTKLFALPRTSLVYYLSVGYSP